MGGRLKRACRRQARPALTALAALLPPAGVWAGASGALPPYASDLAMRFAVLVLAGWVVLAAFVRAFVRAGILIEKGILPAPPENAGQ